MGDPVTVRSTPHRSAWAPGPCNFFVAFPTGHHWSRSSGGSPIGHTIDANHASTDYAQEAPPRGRRSLSRTDLRSRRTRPCVLLLQVRRGGVARQRAHGLLDDRDPEWRQGVPEEGIHLGIGLRRRDDGAARHRDHTAGLGQLRARRDPLGDRRVRRHDRRDDGQRPHDRGRQARSRQGIAGCVPRWCGDGLHSRRSRTARPDVRLSPLRRLARGRPGLRDRHRIRARRIVDRTVLTRRRRHLHQGRRRRRRPGRQGRGRNPRRRPAQPGHDRRQRRRQRGRRRRYGRRPVRVVCRVDHRPDLPDRVRDRDRRRGRRATTA